MCSKTFLPARNASATLQRSDAGGPLDDPALDKITAKAVTPILPQIGGFLQAGEGFLAAEDFHGFEKRGADLATREGDAEGHK